MPARLPSLGQFGVQQPVIDIMLPIGHGQLPLQPSSIPARLPSAGQVGVQMQVPCAQRPLVPQPLPPQSQVSMQAPLLQTLPELQTTPAHRFLTQVPPLQTSPLAHCTPAQGFAAAQVRAHAWPAPQFALQALSIVHLPPSQYCPEGQVTPLHASRKQPAMQAPFTHVSLLGHVTPAQGSLVGTQVALQLPPAPQPMTFAPAHGSD
jgi:hypothetical protein